MMGFVACWRWCVRRSGCEAVSMPVRWASSKFGGQPVLIISATVGGAHLTDIGPPVGPDRPTGLGVARLWVWFRAIRFAPGNLRRRLTQRVVADRHRRAGGARSIVAHRLIRQLQILLQRQPGPDFFTLQNPVIGAHRF